MVVDVLGLMIDTAIVAVFVPESWLEPLEAFCFANLGANGFGADGARIRCTFAELKRMYSRRPRDAT
jgi:hypothetical protein